MRHNRLNEERKAFSAFIKDRKNKKNIIMIVTVAVLIAAASLGKNVLSGTSYLTLDDGSVSGTFSSIQITEGTGTGDTIVIDSSTVVTTENIEYYIGDVAEAIPEDILNEALV